MCLYVLLAAMMQQYAPPVQQRPVAPAPSLSPPAGPGPPLLFNLDVNIGGGQTKRIRVYEGDHMGVLARDFVKQHELPGHYVGRVHHLLETTRANVSK